jgi:hypothetical protein
MTSKIRIYEKIQSIIDEEINKSKGIILERCRSLFDEILRETGNNEFRMNGENNISISLEDIEQPVQDKEDNVDENAGDGDGENVNQDDESDDEVPVYEIEINSTTYYVSDEEPNFIFEKLQDEGVGDCVGIYRDDVPYFITYYNGERCYLNTIEGSYFKYISPSVIGEEIQ